MQKKWQFNQRSSADDVVSGHRLDDKTVVITGANTGIGFETARALASVGANVILACRNTDAGQRAVETILQQHQDASVRCTQLDLGALPSVQDFAEKLKEEKIDILICNAGSMSTSLLYTEQGFERTVGVCHLGHFLLCKLLLPKLVAAKTARVVMLSSEAHRYPSTLNIDTLLDPGANYATMKAYGQAKLCNALMALELQKRFSSQGLTACSVHPGNMVSTDFGRESALMRLAFKLISPFTKSANQGAATSVFCATHEPAEDLAGLYFSHCQATKATKEARNDEVAATLWEQSEHWLKEWL